METPNEKEVVVIVPAAGAGKRLGGKRKQFRALGDAPLLVQTLRRFQEHPLVSSILVAAPESETEALLTDLKAAGISKLISVVPGGPTRKASVERALKAVPTTAEVVLVHDGVRPFVDEASITSVIERTFEIGAAALAVPASDTLRTGVDGYFDETVPREHVFHMQTPQGFRRAVLAEAYRRAVEEAWEATDDVELVRLCGRKVAVVEGSPLNMKITTADDWKLAQLLWKEHAPGA